ncbi:MAG TPA: hypothetical protein VM925_09605 [Labilithrix sp.]|nr:hypothetical protein [Labilithrix sp.]
MNADPRASRSSWTRLLSAISWVLIAASPLVLYVAVTRARLHEAALLVFAFAVLRALPAVLAAERRHLWAALRLPLVAVASAGVGLLTGEARALLVLPSLSQAGFAGVFLTSLRGVPLVEHFARMQKAELRAEEVRYCRTVTVVWGVILAIAALGGLVLAAWAPIEVWTAFTAVGSYVLVGLVFGIEYLVRKIRFREYGAMPVDRILSKLFPPSAPSPPAPQTSSDGVRELDLEHGDGGSVEVTIPHDYAFFRGHFPSTPMLPGVVQLTEIVLPIVRRRHPEVGALRQLKRVRFRRPVLPGETLRVDVGDIERGSDTADAGRADLRFDLRVGDAVVASGSMSFDSTRKRP